MDVEDEDLGFWNVGCGSSRVMGAKDLDLKLVIREWPCRNRCNYFDLTIRFGKSCCQVKEEFESLQSLLEATRCHSSCS